MAANRFELLATWYLRFNGYFTTPDFTLHGDFKASGNRTDVDILAVRFPYSAEQQRRFKFQRHPQLVSNDLTDFAICEVKSRQACTVNDPWLNPKKENVEYALRWMGFTQDEDLIKKCAKEIYTSGKWRSEELPIQVRFICFGDKENDQLGLEGALQLEHRAVVAFLRERFTTNCYGTTRSHWDQEIQDFASLCQGTNDPDQLLSWATGASNAPAPNRYN